MPTTSSAALFCALLVSSSVSLLGADAPLDSHLEPLRPLLGRTWKGEFKGSTADNPAVDVSRWERALNGKAVRLLHSINDGVYGGESLFVWDEEKKVVCYYYFTTAGFMTKGTITFETGKFITNEKVSGSAGGITEVKGTTELLPGGGFHVKSEHLKNGEWTPGHDVTYKEDPNAKVEFK